MGFQYPGPEVTVTSIHISLSRTAHGALAKGKALRKAELHALQGKENQELLSIGSGHPHMPREAEQLAVTDGWGDMETDSRRQKSIPEQVHLLLSSFSIVLTTAKSAKLGPRRGKESFLSSSDFTVLIALLPSSSRGMSTNQNYLKNSKRNSAFRL